MKKPKRDIVAFIKNNEIQQERKRIQEIKDIMDKPVKSFADIQKLKDNRDYVWKIQNDKTN